MDTHVIHTYMKMRNNSWEFILSFCRGFSGSTSGWQACVRSAFAYRTVPPVPNDEIWIPTWIALKTQRHINCYTHGHISPVSSLLNGRTLNCDFLGPLYRRKMLCLLPWWESLGSWLERWEFPGGKCWHRGRHGLLPSQKRNDLRH